MIEYASLAANASEQITPPVLDWSRPQTPFFLTWLVFFCSVTIVSGIWFHIRRNIQPIKARLPWLNGLANIVNIFLTFLLCFNRMLSATFPCELDQFQGYLYLLLGIIYSIRLWVLHYRFQLTQELATSHLMKMGSIGRKRRADIVPERKMQKRLSQNQLFPDVQTNSAYWYSRNNWLISVWFLSLISIISIIIILVLPTYTVIFHGVKDAGGAANDRCSGLSQFFQLILYGIFILIYLTFACKLSSAFDYFHIKEELKYTGYILIPFAILWFLAAALIRRPTFPVSTLISATLLVIAQFMSTIYPLYLSIYQSPTLNLEAVRDVKSFRDLLSNDDGFDSFKQFLEGEFAIENLLFFQGVEDFREISTITINHHLHAATDDTSPTCPPKDTTAIREGYLEKYGNRLMPWRRRYCVVKPNLLLLYPSKTSSEIDVQIEFDRGLHIRLISLTLRPFCFEVEIPSQKKKRKVFAVADEKERQSWIRALKFACPSATEEGEKKEDVKLSGNESSFERPLSFPRLISGPRTATSSIGGEDEKTGIEMTRVDISRLEGETDKLATLPRRAPRGTRFIGEKERDGSGAVGSEKSSTTDFRAQQPILGDNWRLELLSYALEIYFCYLHPEAFAKVQVSESSVTTCSQELGLKNLNDSEDNKENKEKDKDVEEEPSFSESSQTALDFNHLMKLAVQLYPKVDIEKIPQIFDLAQDEIFSYMHGDSFRRYLRSHLYRDLVEEQEKKKHERLALTVNKFL